MPIHPHDERTYQIIGAAMEVHRILHRGPKEELYCDALEVEFELRNIPSERAVPCRLIYKNRPLGGCYFIDFVCYGEIVIEGKAVSGMTPLNFGAKSLEYRRFVLDVVSQ